MPDQPTQPGKYKIELKIGDFETKAEADNVFDALSKLKKPEQIKELAYFKIIFNNSKLERRLTVPKLTSLFGRPVYRKIMAKQLESYLR